MKNSTEKKIVIVCAIVCVIGFFIGGMGYLLGGKKGFSVGFANGKLENGSESSNMISKEVKLEEFDELSFDFGSYDFTMKEGEEYKLEYCTSEKSLPEIEQKGNKLYLKETPYVGIKIDFNFKEKDTVVLTVPKGDKTYALEGDMSSGNCVFDNIDLKGTMKVSSGKLEINNSNSSEDFEVKMSSGNASVNGGSFNNLIFDTSSGSVKGYDIVASKVYLDADSGHLSLDNVSSDSLEIKLGSGDVDVSEGKVGNIKVDMHSGDVNLGLFGNEEDYCFDFSLGSGTIKVDGQKYEDGRYNKSSEKDMEVTVSSGTCKINFAN